MVTPVNLDPSHAEWGQLGTDKLSGALQKICMRGSNPPTLSPYRCLVQMDVCPQRERQVRSELKRRHSLLNEDQNIWWYFLNITKYTNLTISIGDMGCQKRDDWHFRLATPAMDLFPDQVKRRFYLQAHSFYQNRTIELSWVPHTKIKYSYLIFVLLA